MLNQIKKDLQKLKNPKKAGSDSRFFKTGKGEYGEGDVFLGIGVPSQRKIAKKYIHLSLNDLKTLLKSKIHEYLFTALVILVSKYKKADQNQKEKIADFYLKNIKWINNWDLVDMSAPQILGQYLLDKDRLILYKLAGSSNLWKKRIAILSTFSFIKNNQFKETLKISEILLNDNHDLIHKAVGWMLREIGKKDQPVEEKFLKKHSKNMPRTALRYAIERFDKKKKKYYLTLPYLKRSRTSKG